MVIDLKHNLLPVLRPLGVLRDEFLDVLARFFGGSVHDTQSRDVLYPNNEPYELKVTFSKEGDVTGIFALVALPQTKLDALVCSIREELTDSTAAGFGRRVFFSLYPVRGWWRYRDKFQILPVPAQAPKGTALYSDHPFLIEHRYRKTDRGSIDASRREREASNLGLLLNALLLPWIKWIPTRTVGTRSHSWVLLPHEPDEGGRVAHCQELYTYEGYSSVGDDFSPVTGFPKIAEIPPEQYYSLRWVPTGDPFDLPSELTQTLDAFYALNDDDRQRVLDACYWLSQGNETASFSLMLLGAIQAIEAMIPKPRGGRRCPKCNLTQGPSRTKLFDKFLDTFAPIGKQGVEERSQLYGARSGLSHGFSPPFLADTSTAFFTLNPKDFEQRDRVGQASRVARACIRNWIYSEPFIHEHAAMAAYYLWEKDNRVHGRDKAHWDQAIAELRRLQFMLSEDTER